MVFSQQVKIVYKFQKTSYFSCLLEIDYCYSPLFQSLQNALFLVFLALMQMSCPLNNELSELRREEIVAVCGLPDVFIYII